MVTMDISTCPMTISGTINELMAFRMLKRLVKADVVCHEIGGYFDIKF